MAMLADIPRPINSQRRINRVGARIEFMAAGVGFIALLVTEFMHFLLVPDLGRRWERLLAESVSAATVALLTAMLMKAVQRHRAAILLRLQVISEMNQHVRTALTEISVTVESIENQQCIQKISKNVGHIEWALREILLRPSPIAETAGSDNWPGRKKGKIHDEQRIQRAARKTGSSTRRTTTTPDEPGAGNTRPGSGHSSGQRRPERDQSV